MVSPASGRGRAGAAGATACSVAARTSAGAVGVLRQDQEVDGGADGEEDNQAPADEPAAPARLRLERSLPLVELEIIEIGHKAVYTCTLDDRGQRWAGPEAATKKKAGRERRVGNRPGSAWEERLTLIQTMQLRKPNKAKSTRSSGQRSVRGLQ